MKKGDIRRIKKNRSYKAEEFSNLLGIHKVTVFKLLKLSKIEFSGYYNCSRLYSGNEFKIFLLKRWDDKKIRLKETEMYCLKCRKAIEVKEVRIIDKGITIGKGVKQLQAQGKCSECGQLTNKFITSVPIKWKDIKITTLEYKPEAKVKDANKIVFKISKEPISDQLSFLQTLNSHEQK